MKSRMLIPIVLGSVLAGSCDRSAAPVPIASLADPVPTEQADDCLVWARAHGTTCTNALDCSESIISHTVCADGCGATWEEAAYMATASLASFTCLGSDCGCCEYVVDQDFNVCGM